jgi:secreted trypsin-like serine protease
MKSFSKILALPLAFSMLACGSQKSAEVVSSESTARIINGTSVSREEAIARSTVALVMITESGSESSCTGTLIDAHIVLTAAHCLLGSENDSVNRAFVLFVNNFDEIAQETIRPVVNLTVHPEFGFRGQGQGTWNDISLFKFEGDIPAGYAPVPYLSDLSKLQVGMKMLIAGFGMTNSLGGESAPGEEGGGSLLKAEVKLKTASHEGGEIVTDTRDLQTGTCKGDSGGPIYIEKNGQLTVAGITSRGTSLRCDDISVFTSTAFQASFIAESITTLNAQP